MTRVQEEQPKCPRTTRDASGFTSTGDGIVTVSRSRFGAIRAWYAEWYRLRNRPVPKWWGVGVAELYQLKASIMTSELPEREPKPAPAPKPKVEKPPKPPKEPKPPRPPKEPKPPKPPKPPKVVVPKPPKPSPEQPVVAYDVREIRPKYWRAQHIASGLVRFGSSRNAALAQARSAVEHRYTQKDTK